MEELQTEMEYCESCGRKLTKAKTMRYCAQCEYEDSPRAKRKAVDLRRREERKISRIVRPM